jgi:xylulokinase
MSLMGIDIGTTGCKAAVFDSAGAIIVSDYREYDIIRQLPGQAELDSFEVWNKIAQTISSCAKYTGPDKIEAISVASMGEAMVPVDKNGDICGNSALGTDTRGMAYLEQLTTLLPAIEIYRITGQPAGAGYSLPDLCRIKNEEPELYAKTVAFLPWADFVTYKLTGKMTINYSLAGRTLLFDLNHHCWSQEIAAAAKFDLAKLPPLQPSGLSLGRISEKTGKDFGLPPDVQVITGTHDQCAATLGAGVSESATAMLGLGTYACMVMVHGRPESNSPFVRLGVNIENHAIAEQYVSFIYHGSCGSLLKWLRDEMFRDLHGDDIYPQMFAELNLAKTSPALLPLFAETGPLDYAAGGQGAICGLSFSHSRAEILKAALEGSIYYFKDALDRLSSGGSPVRRVHVSGGGAESPIWRQMIADILDIPVIKPQVRECGALGAAIIAGVGAGRYKSFGAAVSSMVKIDSEYRPRPEHQKQYAAAFERYSGLKRVLSACKI